MRFRSLFAGGAGSAGDERVAGGDEKLKREGAEMITPANNLHTQGPRALLAIFKSCYMLYGWNCMALQTSSVLSATYYQQGAGLVSVPLSYRVYNGVI